MMSFLVIAFSPSARAQSGGGAGSFLRQEVGARATALGGAFTAPADDSTSIYWNPAGLARLKKPEVAATHVILFEDTVYDLVAAAYPHKRWGTFAGAYARQSSGGFEKRATPFDAAVTFNIEQSATMLGWGRGFDPGWPVGAGLAFKSVREKVDTASASGFGADLGAWVRPRSGPLTVALYYHNAMAPSLTFVSQPIKYARGWDLGAAYERRLARDLDGLASLRLSKFGDSRLEASGGMELWFRKLAAVRFGQSERGMSYGVGFRLGNTQLDYAMLMHDLGVSHQMSFGLRFGRTREELELLIRKGIERFSQDEARGLARAYRGKAELALKEGNYPEAVRNLEAAGLWDPTDEGIARRLAEVRADLDQAIGRQIIERTALLAQQYHERGNLPASLAYWESVLELSPGNVQAAEAVGRIQKQLGEGAREDLERRRLETATRQVDVLLAAARRFMEKDDFRSAIVRLQDAVRAIPDHAQAKELLAQARARLAELIERLLKEARQWLDAKEGAKALKAAEAVLLQDPQNAPAKELYQQAKTSLGPLSQEAQKQVEKMYYVAVDAYLKERYDEALAQTQAILAQDPLNEHARKLQEKVKAALLIKK